eukprot:COSAG04_NODE_6892_length_1233_cov_3.172673_1_plen_32_part_10
MLRLVGDPRTDRDMYVYTFGGGATSSRHTSGG